MKSKREMSWGWRFRKPLVLAVVLLIITMAAEVKAATAHNQTEAVNWASAQIGQGLDYDKVYGNQCVDLIKYYYDYLGYASYATGNANAYAANTLPAGWKRVYSDYQPGDIAVWKVNHNCSTCNTGSLGHVGIITSADSVGFNAVNQNFSGTPTCTQNWFYVSALQCAIRPDFNNGGQTSGSLSYSALNVAWTDTWNALLQGKISNPNRLTVSNVGVQIWDSAGNMVVNHSEACGLNTSTVNQELNIVGEALPTGLRQGETYTFCMWASANGTAYQSGVGSFTIRDEQQPVITDVYVSDVSETGYTVHCTVTDNFRVDRVQFPTWTLYNGQDDIVPDWGSNSLCSGTADGNYYTYRVNISDHNYELGEYFTHIYAYDPAGNTSNVAIVPVQNIQKQTEKQFYTLTFQGNGGTRLSTDSITVEENQFLWELPTVQRKNYAFRGWYTAINGGSKVNVGMAVTKSQTLYAQWTKIAKPKKVSVSSLKKRGKGKFTVKYRKAAGADGYEVSYSLKKNFKSGTKKSSVSSLSKSVRGLKKGKVYYVRIRAYTTDSTGSRVYGSYSKVKKVRV